MGPVSLALLAVLGPAAVAVVLALAPGLRARWQVAAGLSVSAAAVSLAAAAGALWGFVRTGPAEVVVPWLPGAAGPLAELGVRVDGTSATMLVAVTLVALCVQVFSVGYLHGEPGKAIGRYFTYQSLFVFSMGSLVVAPNLLQLFLGWELVGVTSYLLIGHYYRKHSAARAAVKAFWVTKAADVGLLLALMALRVETGTFAWTAAVTGGAATFIALMLLLAVMGKSAQFPLHVWLPNAMEGPTPVSALLHAATMVAAGVFLVVRTYPLFEASPTALLVMAHVGGFTALFGALLAVVQTDIKRLLAYSTCSQLGYMLAALGAGAVLGGYFHLLTHAAFKALLFLAAGNVIHAVHSNEMTDMGGLAKPMRWTAAAFTVAALALAGLPGLSGGFSKELVLDGVAARGLWAVYAALLAAVPLTAFYMGRAVLRTFHGAPSHAAAHAHEAPASMLGPVLLLLVPTVGGGFLAGPLATALGLTWHFHVSATSVAATALALLGLVAAWAAGREGALARALAGATAGVRRLADAALVDRLYEAGFRGGLLRVAAVAAWVDRYVVDALMNALGAGVLAAGRRVRPLQTGLVSDYVFVVASGVVLLVLWGAFR